MSGLRLLAIRTPTDLFDYIRLLLTDSRYFTTLAILLVFGDALFTQLIIHLVSYTEIDWETYMHQLVLYLNGERNYSQISGPTGPLVYPAGHLYVHRFLHLITMAGENIWRAQQIYGVLYIASLALTCAVYHQAGGVPNWALLFLPLSKRLHSIFVLRLFNDCWSVIAAQGAIFAYGRGSNLAGTLLYSASLSVKMSALLYLPGILVVLFKRGNIQGVVGHLLVLLVTQAAIAMPFLKGNASDYLRGAFDFGRVFLYKWTVNWRFVGEEIFSNTLFARYLLVAHCGILIAFGLFKWCRSDGGAAVVIRRGLSNFHIWGYSPVLVPVDTDYVTTVLMTSNLVGIIFARSLHYQFYSWYAQQLPFLLWRTKFPVVIKVAVLFAIEYAWNIFPSTVASSCVLLGAHVLLLVGVFCGYPEGVRNAGGLGRQSDKQRKST